MSLAALDPVAAVHVAGDRSTLGRRALVVLGALLLLVMGAGLVVGASDASLGRLVAHWAGAAVDPALVQRDRLVLLDIRLPRVLLAGLVGAGLAVSGVLMQGLFRNPLADPGLVGVSSGAGLGAVLVIVLGGTALAPLVGLLGIYGLQVAAFAGGLATTALLYGIATRGGRTEVATLLLAGIAIAAMVGAIMGLMIYVASDAQLRDFTFWSLGSLAGANWQKVAASAPLILAAIGAALTLGAGLNALTLGEATARHLGTDVERLKRLAIVAVAAATGAAVAVSGGIGFVGIVVPHLIRLRIGPDHRYLVPAAALFGAAFLIGADTVSRLVVAPAELPIGIVTAAVGGPFFLWLLLRRTGGTIG